jgi:hypothetical protein
VFDLNFTLHVRPTILWIPVYGLALPEPEGWREIDKRTLYLKVMDRHASVLYVLDAMDADNSEDLHLATGDGCFELRPSRYEKHADSTSESRPQ